MQAIQQGRDYSTPRNRHASGTGDREERRCILTQYRNLESRLCFLSGYLLAVVRSLENRLRTVAVGSKKRI